MQFITQAKIESQCWREFPLIRHEEIICLADKWRVERSGCAAGGAGQAQQEIRISKVGVAVREGKIPVKRGGGRHITCVVESNLSAGVNCMLAVHPGQVFLKDFVVVVKARRPVDLLRDGG